MADSATVAATPSLTSDRTRSVKVRSEVCGSPSTVVVVVRVIWGMVMLVAVRPARASAFSTSSPEKIARRVASSALESTASISGISTLKDEETVDAVDSAAGASLVLVFWAQAAPAGSATLKRQAVARTLKRRTRLVLNTIVVSPLVVVGKARLGCAAQ